MNKKDEPGGGAGLRGEKVAELTACGNVLLTSVFQGQEDSRGKASSPKPPCLPEGPLLGPSRLGFHTEPGARSTRTSGSERKKTHFSATS